MDDYVPYKIKAHKKAFRKKCFLAFFKIVILYIFIHQFIFKIVKVSDNFSLEVPKGSYCFVFPYYPQLSFSPKKGDIVLVKILSLKATWIEIFLRFVSLGILKESEWKNENNAYRFYKVLATEGDKISFLKNGKSFTIVSSQEKHTEVTYDLPFESPLFREFFKEITLQRDEYFVILTGAKKEQAIHYGEVVSHDQIVGKILASF